MKKLYFLAPLLMLLLAACSKRDYYAPSPVSPYEWMRTHDRGVVAYVDYSTGNYIVETYNGYTVVELWEEIGPVEGDLEYADFNRRGIQTIYNQTGDYFTEGRVIESYLTWNEAIYVLDDMKW